MQTQGGTAPAAAAERNFGELLQTQWDAGKFVCVGLDSKFEKLPQCIKILAALGDEGKQLSDEEKAAAQVGFNEAIIRATCDIAGMYKVNSAFYEALGTPGWQAMAETFEIIHHWAPGAVRIWDAKRGDIDSTNDGYVDAMSVTDNAMSLADDAEKLTRLGADAITVHPYLGSEAMSPFLNQKNKGVIVLVRTSNKGAGQLQDLPIQTGVGTVPLYHEVARIVRDGWNWNGNCAVVAGANHPNELKRVRNTVRDSIPILMPGVGFQQKDVPLEEQVHQAISAGQNSRGQGMIINSSRGIIFASSGTDFAERARAEALKLHQLIQQCLGVGGVA